MKVSQIKLDADFDGEKADISLDLTKDGYNVQLDKHALAKMLNVRSVNKPMHTRLKSTFSKKRIPLEQMQIEFDTPFYHPLLEKVEQNPMLDEVPMLVEVPQKMIKSKKTRANKRRKSSRKSRKQLLEKVGQKA